MTRKTNIVIAIIAFICAGVALLSFEEAVFQPIVNLVVSYFGDRWETYALLLGVSSIILIVVLKRRLPFTS